MTKLELNLPLAFSPTIKLAVGGMAIIMNIHLTGVMA
jgi:hypothetical protein